MSSRSYSMPSTAVCPGCGAIVTLPPEPLFPDSPPAICGTCETEVPDYRRGSLRPGNQGAKTRTSGFRPPAYSPPPRNAGYATQPDHPGAPPPLPRSASAPEVPPEQRRYSRGKLFKSIGGIIAEHGAKTVEHAKDVFPT